MGSKPCACNLPTKKTSFVDLMCVSMQAIPIGEDIEKFFSNNDDCIWVLYS
jgi:hypothetical protein